MSIRNSKKRNRILEILRKSSNSHFTADEMYRKVQKDFPKISLGTVYRNLHQLAQNGEILEIQIGQEPAIFEYPPNPHPHFICTHCGSIFNLEVPIEKLIVRGVEKNDGHRVEKMDIFIKGICKNCLHIGESNE